MVNHLEKKNNTQKSGVVESGSLQLFRLALDSSADQVFLIDSDEMRFVDVNETACSALLYTRDELLAMGPHDIKPLHTLESLKAEFDRIFSGQSSGIIETVHQRKDGGSIPVEVRLRLVESTPRKLIIALATDVTERMKFEEDLKYQNLLLRTQNESSLDGILVLDSHDNVISFNRRFAEMWSIPEDILQSQSGDDALHFVLPQLPDPEKFAETIAAIYKKKGDKSHDEVRLKDGSIFDRYSAPLNDPDGAYYGRVWYYRDVTQQRELEEEKDYYGRAQSLLAEISRDFILSNSDNIDEKIDRMLAKTAEFIGVDKGVVFRFSADYERISNTHEWCRSGIVPQKAHMQDLPARDIPWFYRRIVDEKAVVDVADISLLPDEAAATKDMFRQFGIQSVLAMPVVLQRGVWGVVGFNHMKTPWHWDEMVAHLLEVMSNVLADSLQRIEAERQLRYMTYHDTLTGLYNRQFFEVEKQRMDVPRKLPLSIILCDMNGMKRINDTFGHKSGDDALKKIADSIRNSIRNEDVVSRWGGDEFVVLLPSTEHTEAGRISERILEAVNDLKVQGRPISVACGYATKEKAGQSLNTVFQQADKQMYKFKLNQKKGHL